MIVTKKCLVIDCNRTQVAHELCDLHRKRKDRHGSIDAGRPVDWGIRTIHPVYTQWKGLIRYHKLSMDVRWHDFWIFANEVPDKPKSSWVKLVRLVKEKPWQVGNVAWREIKNTPEDRETAKLLAKNHSKKLRYVNPDYFRNKDLIRNYGVTLEWYNQQLQKQNNVCAICGKPESMKIKGNLVSLAVDHCHDSGEVRGLLCCSCNRAIGLLKHDIELLQSAMRYLTTS